MKAEFHSNRVIPTSEFCIIYIYIERERERERELRMSF
jgi:hypothetical protein